MKLFFINIICLLTLISTNAFAQGTTETNINQWKKAVVKIESIQQRYSFDQVEAMLHKKLDTVKGISQHDRYNQQSELLVIKDTIRGTGTLIADGTKIYLVTAKHIVKATDNVGNVENINDLISIKTNINGKISNDISLMNLAGNNKNIQPFIFSSNEDDLAIISFQKNDYKAIVAYIKQEGCEPLPLSIIVQTGKIMVDEDILTIGFPALPGPNRNESITSKGKVAGYWEPTPHLVAEKMTLYPGDSGAPIIRNDKLIGIIASAPPGFENVHVAEHPYEKTDKGTFVMSSKLIPLLKQLQEHEKNPSFSK